MKKLYALFALLTSLATFAQAPEGFNYQATVRNSTGALIIKQNVTFKFNIIKDSPTSLPIYSETHYVPTDDLGTVNLIIGKGTSDTGTFSSINWGLGTYYLGIELNTGSGFIAMGTTQMLSVPYALYAKSAGTTQNLGRVSIYMQGNITDQQALAQIAQELGPLTENIFVKNTTGLTTLDLSKLTKGTSISIEDNKDLASINLNGLTTLGDYLEISDNPSLVSLSLAAFTYGGISISRSSLIFLSLPQLTSGSIEITDTSLTSLSLPSYTKSSGFYLRDNKSLTSINISSLTTSTTPYFDLIGNSFPSSEINNLLNILNTKVTFPPSSQIYLNSQNPPAPPTEHGITDKLALIAKGVNVTTD